MFYFDWIEYKEIVIVIEYGNFDFEVIVKCGC